MAGNTGFPLPGGVYLVSNAWADDYFVTRYGAAALWTPLSEADKTAALATAEAQLKQRYSVGVTDGDKAAVCEQALFLVLSGAGADRRAALQAQGVTAASMVGESYAPRDGGPAIAFYACQFYGATAPVHGGILTRDDSL